jgi:hypothetical protein
MSHPLYHLLNQLEAARIHFTVGRYRPDSVLMTLTTAGERVEVDVFADGTMEVSRFVGRENLVGGVELVAQIISDNAEPCA